MNEEAALAGEEMAWVARCTMGYLLMAYRNCALVACLFINCAPCSPAISSPLAGKGGKRDQQSNKGDANTG